MQYHDYGFGITILNRTESRVFRIKKTSTEFTLDLYIFRLSWKAE